jgi:hypothetical protein
MPEGVVKGVSGPEERINDIIDTPEFTRDIQGNVALLTETLTEFVFGGLWVWSTPAPDSCDQLAAHPEARAEREEHAYGYDHVGGAIAELKAARPGVIFCGAVPAQVISSRQG